MKKLIRKIGTLTAFYILTAMSTRIAFAIDPTAPVKIRYELEEPLGNVAVIESDSAIGFIQEYIRVMYIYGASFLGLVAVLVIAVSGMQYSISPDSAEEAKKRIINSLSGLAVLFLSALFLYFINPNFFTLQ